jgi:hypothetical protein
MIFYFSGTGNSLQVAKSIAEHNNEKLISIVGAPFWHNEASVDHGTLTVPLTYYGGGLSISWDTNVYHWSDTATSYGAGIPQ